MSDILCISPKESPGENYGKSFLAHLLYSFGSWDVQNFVIFFLFGQTFKIDRGS